MENRLPTRCSDQEFERRLDALRGKMRGAGVDCCLCYGTFQGWQNVFYLSNHWDLITCWLMIPRDSEPVLLNGMYPHLVVAQQRAVIEDVRFGGRDSLDLVKDELQHRGLHQGIIALVEPDSYRIPGIPHRDMDALRKLFPKAEFTDFTVQVEELRRRKSEEELEILRTSARATDDAFDRLLDSVRPGVTELELAHVLMGAAGDTVALLLGSTSMNAPDLPYPSIRPSGREVRQGDVILVELSKGYAGYAGQLHGTVTLGPPTERYERIHEVAYSAYQAISGVLREGCTPAEVVEAGQVIPDNGFVAADPLTHGFGLGIEPGLFVGLQDQPGYWPNADFRFPAGASLTIEPNPCTEDMTCGGTAGGLVVVKEDGCEQLHDASHRGIVQV